MKLSKVFLFSCLLLINAGLFGQSIKKTFGLNYSMIASDKNYTKLFLRDLGGLSAHIRLNQNYGLSFSPFTRFSIGNWDLNIGPRFLYRRWGVLSEETNNYFPKQGLSQSWQNSNIWSIELPIILAIPIKITNDLYVKPLIGYSLDYLILPKKDLLTVPIPNYEFQEVFQLNTSRSFNHSAISGMNLHIKTEKSGIFEFNVQVYMQMFKQVYFTHKTIPEYQMYFSTRSTESIRAFYTTMGITWCLPYRESIN